MTPEERLDRVIDILAAAVVRCTGIIDAAPKDPPRLDLPSERNVRSRPDEKGDSPTISRQ
jgi:hypothetical protein